MDVKIDDLDDAVDLDMEERKRLDHFHLSSGNISINFGILSRPKTILLHSKAEPVPAVPCKELYRLSRADVGRSSSKGEEEEEDDKEITAAKEFISKFGAALPIFFLSAAIIAGTLYVCGFLESDIKQYIIWILLVTIALAGLLGMWAVYQYGVISDQIDRISFENERYEKHMVELEGHRVALSQDLDNLQITNENLKRDALQIEEQNKDFESLMHDLDDVARDDETVADVVRNVHKICRDMQSIVLETDRAFLLQTFYECAFKREDVGMDERAYQKFLGRLSKKQRDRFEVMSFRERATVDESGREAIGKSQFLDIIEEVLGNVDSVLEVI